MPVSSTICMLSVISKWYFCHRFAVAKLLRCIPWMFAFTCDGDSIHGPIWHRRRWTDFVPSPELLVLLIITIGSKFARYWEPRNCLKQSWTVIYWAVRVRLESNQKTLFGAICSIVWLICPGDDVRWCYQIMFKCSYTAIGVYLSTW